MTPERWQQINDLFQVAVELAPGQRAAFLDAACTTDEMLRSEIESLLASDEHEWDLIEKPALEVAAPLLANEQPQLAPGQNLGHYEIVSLIGRGGMGEVYLAKDARLNRRIALKLLPIDYTRNKDRLRRFQLEAQAASALNHPNILTIHELGEVDGQQFIATEFVEGETLRQRMKRAGLSISEVLDVAVQATSALAAAHKAGIVHRDIKPENIMLRPDGYVKVLDFGLAKLTEQHEPTAEARAVDDPETSSGLVMGTVKYMSPEQARGLPVDARSDIFSLGVVFYEMLTGHTPFKGKTASDLIKSILRDEPPSLTEYAPEAPEQLQRIVSKSLSKEKAKRYQTAEGLLVDLKALELGAALTMQHVLSQIRKHKAGAALGLIALIIVLAGTTYSLTKLISKRAARTAHMEITRLPGTDRALSAAISPDGNYVVYVAIEGDRQSVWARHLASERSVQIIPAVEAHYIYLTFAPTGNYFYFTKFDKGQSENALYEMSVLGGVPKKIMDKVDSNLSFSPDGKRFGFVRGLDQGKTALMLTDADGSRAEEMATRQGPNIFISPAWSPDGKVIACSVSASDGKNAYFTVVELPANGGPERPITTRRWNLIGELVWIADGSALIMTAVDQGQGPRQIWQLEYPSGESRKVTNDIINYGGLSLTADSELLTSVQFQMQTNIWIAPAGNLSRIKQVTFSQHDFYRFVVWTPDGRLVYPSSTSGHRDIWIMNDDGTGEKQLTQGAGENMYPSVSPDGRYIVFVSDLAGSFNIWRMNIDGSDRRRLTSGKGELNPHCSPDGRWVIYRSNSSSPNEQGLWRVPIESGKDPERLTNKNAADPTVSPDGKFIAFLHRELPNSGLKIAVIPSEGNRPLRIFDVNPRGPLNWSPDGWFITYIVTSEGTSNIWGQPLDGGSPVRVTNFESDSILGFDWSPDGKFACSRGMMMHDVLMISNFR